MWPEMELRLGDGPVLLPVRVGGVGGVGGGVMV